MSDENSTNSEHAGSTGSTNRNESPTPLNRPKQTLRPENPKPPSKRQAAEQIPPEESSRGNDNMLGRPKQRVQEDIKGRTTMASLHEREEKEESSMLEEDIFVKPISFSFAWMKGLWFLALFFVGLAGWFILSQSMSIIIALQNAPLWLQIPGWLLVAFFTALVVYPLWRLYHRYRSLSEVRQINIVSVSAKGSTAQYQKAREELIHYMNKYPLANSMLLDQLQGFNVNIEHLQEARQYLLNDSQGLDSQCWVEEFEARFLKPLDKAASGRIQHYAKMVALKSAMSPNALLDMALVLYNGFSLLDDLCLLYQVRTNRTGMLYLLGLVILQSYIAGQVEDNLADLAQDNMESILGPMMGGITSFAGSSAAQAGMNYLFLWRIGKSMKLRLRPLK